ncbi:unnamed protein product [Prunus armeniaca]
MEERRKEGNEITENESPPLKQLREKSRAPKNPVFVRLGREDFTKKYESKEEKRKEKKDLAKLEELPTAINGAPHTQQTTTSREQALSLIPEISIISCPIPHFPHIFSYGKPF